MGLRSPLLSLTLLLAVGGVVPLWANSVEASAYAYWDGPIDGAPFNGGYDTSHTQCAQSGTSSASCEASFSTSNYLIWGDAGAGGTAAWGALTAGVSQAAHGSRGYASTSFSDDVTVTGGTGTGTLISHYTLVMQSDGDGSGPNAGGFAFVQGASRTGVLPQFANFWLNPPAGPVPTGCELIGLCFAESFDVSSPVSFGAALPVGALIYMDSTGFGNIMGGGGSSFSGDSSSLQLDGFTVLDADGNVVSDAVVTPQNLPASFNLDFAPEPGAWGLMLLGLAGLVMWRCRRKAVLPMLGLMVAGSLSPLRANSVEVSAYSYYNGPSPPPFYGTYDTSRTQCAQSGTSSASCEADFSTSYYSIGGSANVAATAAWGSLTAGGSWYDEATAHAATSFSDKVIVTGGTGAGTLISHYTLLMQSYGNGSSPNAGGFVFAQGAARTGVLPQFANYWANPPTGPVPTGCARVGLCFAESFDVSSPVSFGAALPVGALIYMDSTGFGDIGGGSGTNYSTGYSTLQLDGYTVLDADGNVVSDAVVTPQNLPASFNLDFTPEPGTWGLMLMGVGLLGMWRLRRGRAWWPLLLGLRHSLFSIGLLLIGGGVWPLWANSVYVSNSSIQSLSGLGAFTGTFDCEQSGVSSAVCQTDSSSRGGIGSVDSSGTASGTAAFGHVGGSTVEGDAHGLVVTSFSDNVVVSGGGGMGTLVSHYSLVSEGEATIGAQADFVFVQGGSRTGVESSYQYFGTSQVPNPPTGCETVGFCFSETFDVASPVQFGAGTALGAQLYLGTAGGTLIPPNGDTTANASIVLNGYTVLDAGGNVVSDAVVTRENLPASFNLDFTPEPGTWGLMLMGLAGLVIWRWRRKPVLPVVGLVAVCGASPIWANSVYVTNSSSLGLPADYAGPPVTLVGPQTPYCEQAGTSSANCGTGTQAYMPGRGYFGGGGSSSANAAFGALSGLVDETEPSSGYFVASFSDNVIVTGGTGSGTLISHYSLADTGEAVSGGYGTFQFVQGSTKSGVTAMNFLNLGFPPFPPSAPPIPAGCQGAGVCFSESYDVSSPIQFGDALPLGAETYLNSTDFGDQFTDGVEHVEADSRLTLTGFTVLDASGNTVSDAVVTPQNLPASFNLDFTPEPGAWVLMLVGLAGLLMWRGRRGKWECC